MLSTAEPFPSYAGRQILSSPSFLCDFSRDDYVIPAETGERSENRQLDHADQAAKKNRLTSWPDFGIFISVLYGLVISIIIILGRIWRG